MNQLHLLVKDVKNFADSGPLDSHKLYPGAVGSNEVRLGQDITIARIPETDQWVVYGPSLHTLLNVFQRDGYVISTPEN